MPEKFYPDDKDTGPYACHLPATYPRSVSGDSLTFVKVNDECAGRAAVLAAHPSHARALSRKAVAVRRAIDARRRELAG